MIYALNKDGVKIGVYEAIKGEIYTCPICNNRVILRQGGTNIEHFSHNSDSCKDKWNYDMSKWHKRMQDYFPKESQ